MSILRYTAPAYASRLLILFADLSLAFISIHLAALLRFNFDFSKSFELFDSIILLVMFIRIVSFRWFRTYAVIVRFIGALDLLQVILAVTGGSVFLFGLSILLRPHGFAIPMSILTIDFFLLLSLMSALRLAMPVLYRLIFQPQGLSTNIIIIGAIPPNIKSKSICIYSRTIYTSTIFYR